MDLSSSAGCVCQLSSISGSGGRRLVDRDSHVSISTFCIVVCAKLVVSMYTILSLYNNILWTYDVATTPYKTIKIDLVLSAK